MGVLNPWSDPSFEKFVNLDRPSQILATGAKSRVDNVKYHRFDLEYRWNRNSKKWQSSSHRGYFLSDKKGEELLKFKSRREANDHKVPTFLPQRSLTIIY